MVAMVTVFNLEKQIMGQFVEYTYKVKLAKFQLPSFRRSAVANKNSLVLPPSPHPRSDRVKKHPDNVRYEGSLRNDH